jgi:hypothetical protein
MRRTTCPTSRSSAAWIRSRSSRPTATRPRRFPIRAPPRSRTKTRSATAHPALDLLQAKPRCAGVQPLEPCARSGGAVQAAEPGGIRARGEAGECAGAPCYRTTTAAATSSTASSSSTSAPAPVAEPEAHRRRATASWPNPVAVVPPVEAVPNRCRSRSRPGTRAAFASRRGRGAPARSVVVIARVFRRTLQGLSRRRRRARRRRPAATRHARPCGASAG